MRRWMINGGRMLFAATLLFATAGGDCSSDFLRDLADELDDDTDFDDIDEFDDIDDFIDDLF